MHETEMVRSLVMTTVLFVIVVGISIPVAAIRLREHHREVWEAMGSPRPFGSPFKASTWRLARFMVSMKHTRLNDLNLSLACVAATLGLLAGVAALVGLVLMKYSGG